MTTNNPTDTNQASEDELEQKLLFLFRRMSVCAATHQGENSEWIDGRCVTPSTAAKEALALIRTEKLKLLAAVRERVIGNASRKAQRAYRIESSDFVAVVKEKAINKKLAEQRAALNKLEAEL